MRAITFLALGLLLLAPVGFVPTAAAACDVTDLGPPTCVVEFVLGRECINSPLDVIHPGLGNDIC